MEKMPQQDELVLVTVKKILPYGAFCALDEYGGTEAFVHISEVAPRWIKNIHEFLSEGQKLVAKVYRVIPEKNQIDISLKRVTEAERKAKIESSRKERRASKLFEAALRVAKSTKNEEVSARAALTEKYGSLIDAIEAISEKGEEALSGIKIERGLASALIEVAVKSIKKAKAEVDGILQIISYSQNGIEEIKRLLLSAKAPPKTELNILYLGAPKYQIRITAEDFKTAEKAMEEIISALQAEAKHLHLSFEFSKIEK